MKKVVAFVGSARKRHTYQAAQQFLANLQSFGDVECEVVPLSDYHLEICRGCKLCLDKGEELCPLKDDRDIMLDDGWRDYVHWRDQGWFESDYYYPTRLGPPKKLVGSFFDWTTTRRTRAR